MTGLTIKELKKNRRKKILALSLVTTIPLIVTGGVAVTWGVYEDAYNIRYETDPNLDLYLNHTDFPELAFEERSFITNRDNRLNVWLYHKKGTVLESKNFKAMIVLAHGMGEGHLPYLPDIKALVDSGYLVFAFDNTGCATSPGIGVKGFPQGIIDLENALDYIKKDSFLSELSLGLYGHSWGAYSVMNIMHKKNNVQAIIERSGPISSKSVFMSVAENEVGKKSLLIEPFLSIVEYLKFGKAAGYNAINAINNGDVPMLLMHSMDDPLIPFKITPLSDKTEITNKNVQLKVYEDGGHDFLMSSEAIKYQKQVFGSIDSLKAESGEITLSDKQAFMKKLDRKKLNEKNPNVMKEITRFFDQIF